MPTIKKKHTLVNFSNVKINAEYIVMHDTGVKGQSAQNNADYFYSEKRGASAHYFVDENDIIEVVDPDKRGWHVGDDRMGDSHDVGDLINNSNSIGIELCPEIDGTFKVATLANGAWLVKKLMKDKTIPAKKVVRHYDASGKNCPQFLNTDKKWTKWYAYHKQITGETVTMAVLGKVSNPSKYTVESGDTLFGISKQYNATVAQIKEWNNLKSDTIVVGQSLTLKADNKPTNNPVLAKETTVAKLNVDGYLGFNAISELQRYFKTPVDGVISKPSSVVKEIQKWLGVTADGLMGSNTISALQKHFGTVVDGKISEPSLLVKEIQKALNSGDLGSVKKVIAKAKVTSNKDTIAVGIQAKVGVKQDGLLGGGSKRGIVKLAQRYVGVNDDGIWGNASANRSKLMRLGDKGLNVYALQAMLYAKGYKSVGKPDGSYGKNTVIAVKQFQKDKGLLVDGVSGIASQMNLFRI